jgi:hypothetical protein
MSKINNMNARPRKPRKNPLLLALLGLLLVAGLVYLFLNRPNHGSGPIPATTPQQQTHAADSVIKTLPTQTADANGTVIWDWDVKQAGFDTGTWQITAVATLNGQTKTTNDPIKLEVQP